MPGPRARRAGPGAGPASRLPGCPGDRASRSGKPGQLDPGCLNGPPGARSTTRPSVAGKQGQRNTKKRPVHVVTMDGAAGDARESSGFAGSLSTPLTGPGMHAIVESFETPYVLARIESSTRPDSPSTQGHPPLPPVPESTTAVHRGLGEGSQGWPMGPQPSRSG